jgi:hypothetical protein
VHNRGRVKSVTIQINDLFKFEGQPVPAQRPDITAMAERVGRSWAARLRGRDGVRHE